MGEFHFIAFQKVEEFTVSEGIYRTDERAQRKGTQTQRSLGEEIPSGVVFVMVLVIVAVHFIFWYRFRCG